MDAIQSEIPRLELILAHIRKLIEPEPVASLLPVSLVDVLQVVLEDLKPPQLLLQRGIRFTVLRHPQLEEVDELVRGCQVLLGIANDGEVCGKGRADNYEVDAEQEKSELGDGGGHELC